MKWLISDVQGFPEVIDEGGEVIVALDCGDEANASLIAAAPEMLELLKRYVASELAKFDEDIAPEVEALIKSLEA